MVNILDEQIQENICITAPNPLQIPFNTSSFNIYPPSVWDNAVRRLFLNKTEFPNCTSIPIGLEIVNATLVNLSDVRLPLFSVTCRLRSCQWTFVVNTTLLLPEGVGEWNLKMFIDYTLVN